MYIGLAVCILQGNLIEIHGLVLVIPLLSVYIIVVEELFYPWILQNSNKSVSCLSISSFLCVRMSCHPIAFLLFPCRILTVCEVHGFFNNCNLNMQSLWQEPTVTEQFTIFQEFGSELLNRSVASIYWQFYHPAVLVSQFLTVVVVVNEVFILPKKLIVIIKLRWISTWWPTEFL